MAPLPNNFIPLGFSYANYRTIEKRMIKVLMERAGYTNLRFDHGNEPRTRKVEAEHNGQPVTFTYKDQTC